MQARSINGSVCEGQVDLLLSQDSLKQLHARASRLQKAFDSAKPKQMLDTFAIKGHFKVVYPTGCSSNFELTSVEINSEISHNNHLITLVPFKDRAFQFAYASLANRMNKELST